MIELNRPRLTIKLVEGQAHRYPHKECLGHLNTTALTRVRIIAIDQEITVIQGLQTQVIKLKISVGVNRLGELLQIKAGKFLV